MTYISGRLIACSLAVATAAVAAPGSAAVIPITQAMFPAGPANLTFTGLADSTEVNGLTTGGVSFAYLLGGTPQNGQLIINGGPGVTNNVSQPNIVSIGNAAGTLVITLPSLVTAFGYGYALLGDGVIPNGTTISVFNGATALGSLSYTAVPDPSFPGGFAGISSTSAFNRVEVTFNAVAADAFALDNIRFNTAAAVPEPTTWAMMLTGFGALGFGLRRRKVRTTVSYA